MKKTLIYLLVSSLLCLGNSYKTLAQDYLNTAKRINLDPVYAPFYHGVASGDPLPDKVIIWTRVTPDTIMTGTVEVCWRISLDTNFSQIVNSGTTYTADSVDYTVKVDVDGLQPNTFYYYEFNALGKNSLTGRTKTAPIGDVDSIRFAVVSCAHFEHGYYNAYERIVNRNDIDAVLHLGDYIYEYAAGGGYTTDTVRKHDPENEILTLADYRIRYSQYHLDPQLRALHQQYPFIVIWDDHETANNSWTGGAENHDTTTEGNWEDRKSAGVQAHHEWLPIRLPDPNVYQRIYRKFSYGDLIDLIMLDTRLEARDEQVGATSPLLDDTSRTLLGATQYNWLINQLSSSTARWKILGQQVMMAPLTFGWPAYTPVNTDQWDGYRAERDKLFNDITNNNINNIVVLTGDIHTSWANDIPFGSYDPPNSGSVGVEFVGTSVTSAALPITLPGGATLIKTLNPHMKYVNLTEKGYLIVDINKTRTQADWYYVTTVDSLLFEDTYAESWYVNNQAKFLNASGTASQKLSPLQPQAPLMPNINTQCVPLAIENPDDSFTKYNDIVLFGTYPNPFTGNILLQYYVYKTTDVRIRLTDITGKVVLVKNIDKVPEGLYEIEINSADISAGTYMLMLETENQVRKRKIVKN